jgi:hypothetical protein
MRAQGVHMNPPQGGGVGELELGKRHGPNRLCRIKAHSQDCLGRNRVAPAGTSHSMARALCRIMVYKPGNITGMHSITWTAVARHGQGERPDIQSNRRSGRLVLIEAETRILPYRDVSVLADTSPLSRHGKLNTTEVRHADNSPQDHENTTIEFKERTAIEAAEEPSGKDSAAPR